MEFTSNQHIFKPGILLSLGLAAEGFGSFPFFQQQRFSRIKSVVQIVFSVLASGVNIFTNFGLAHNKVQQLTCGNCRLFCMRKKNRHLPCQLCTALCALVLELSVRESRTVHLKLAFLDGNGIRNESSYFTTRSFLRPVSIADNPGAFSSFQQRVSSTINSAILVHRIFTREFLAPVLSCFSNSQFAHNKRQQSDSAKAVTKFAGANLPPVLPPRCAGR